MKALLVFSQAVDRVNKAFGDLCNLLVLLSCLVSAGNAMVRYAFNISSNGWLEVQWYMFSAVVMLGASYTLQKNEHVRVDIVYMMLSERGQLWLDIICGCLFMIPVCFMLSALSWPFFLLSFPGEGSNNAGGLLRWPVKLMLPLGFFLLALQGMSEVIKRIAALQGYVVIDAKYERPQQ